MGNQSKVSGIEPRANSSNDFYLIIQNQASLRQRATHTELSFLIKVFRFAQPNISQCAFGKSSKILILQLGLKGSSARISKMHVSKNK